MMGFKDFLKSRKVRYGSYSVILLVAVVAIAVVLNTVLGLDNVRSKMKLDLTPNKLYTMGDKTKEVIKSVDKSVEIIGLFDDTRVDSQYKEVTEFIKQYENINGKINVEFIDPEKNPGFINKELDPDNIRDIQYGDFVVRSGSKIRVLTGYDIFETEFDQNSFSYYTIGSNAENAFTGAIKYVTSAITPVVYFVEGHGERALDTDYRNVKDYLERNNYEVKSVNISTGEDIPEDAKILVFPSPQKDLTVVEKNNIQEYMEKGGNAIFLFDALESNVKMLQFEDLLKEYNIGLDYDIVVEKNSKRHIKDMPYEILPDLQSNAINMNLDPENFMMIMPKSRSINVLNNNKPYLSITPLMKTSQDAIGQLINSDEGDELVGPLNLAVAVESKAKSTPSKILVMGNSYFMTDSGIEKYQMYSMNGLYFFFNSLNWIQDKKEEVLIPTKEYKYPILNMDAFTQTITAIALSILLPLIILGYGIFVWLRRRHLWESIQPLYY